MPPIVKKLIAVLVILALANIGFVLYGQASFDATFQQLSKSFAENNATCKSQAVLPEAMARYLERSGVAKSGYKTFAMQCDGLHAKKRADRFVPMQSLMLLRQTPDMLRALKIDVNSLVTFNALESYHAGRAKMQTYLFGIIPLGTFQSDAFARSELAKVLAYGLFNPALLRCGAISYRVLNEESVEATIRDHNRSAHVVFIFNKKGDIIEARSDDRLRPVKKVLKPSRWRMKILAYGTFDGLRIPAEVEEMWQDDKGDFVSAKYRVTAAQRLR